MLDKIHHLFFDTKREIFPDFLRGLAVLFMIQIHIIENLLIQDPTYYIFEKWSYFLGGIPAAPIFMLLMGYYQAKSKSSLVNEIKRGINLFLLGLILNILLNFSLIYKYLNNQIDVDIYSYILGVDILFLAGLSFIAIAFIKHLILKDYQILIIVLIVHLLNYFFLEINIESIYLKYFLSFFIRGSDWSYFPLISWISFPLFGVYLSRTALLEKILNKKFSNLFWLLYLIIFFASLDYGIKNSYDLNAYYSMRLEFFIYSLFIIFGWIKILKVIYDKFNDGLITGYFAWIGRNVIIVFFLQWVIIGNVTTYLYKSVSLNSCLIIFGIVLFSVSICTYLYNLSRS